MYINNCIIGYNTDSHLPHLVISRHQAQKNAENCLYEDRLVTPRNLGIREAALVAFKAPVRPSKHCLYKVNCGALFKLHISLI